MHMFTKNKTLEQLKHPKIEKGVDPSLPTQLKIYTWW